MMIVKSANDIAVAIAEAVGGSEAAFVAMMNEEAQRLGMTSTHFSNPNGLPDDGRVTTARDLAVLARAAWNDFPEYRAYFRISAIRAGKRVLPSYNTLLERYRGTNGMKTGFICASGFNMVASATRGGRTVIAVVLGESSALDRAETAAKLLAQGFRRGSLGVRPSLATFESAPVTGTPVNMREFGMCGKRQESEEDGANPVLAGMAKGSALEPRFFLMDPVPVYAGRADPPSGVAPTGKVPLPRLRPRPPGTSVAVEADLPPMLVH
jgi:D-alanyl-D-alanine carboxypeptidase